VSFFKELFGGGSAHSVSQEPAYRALPFGDIWCVLFAPGCEIKGLCALCASKGIAEEVIRSINKLPPNTETCVSIKNRNDGSDVIPCVLFYLRDSGGAKTGILDWFGQTVLNSAAPKRADDALESGYSPLLNLSTIHQFIPTSRPYPRSVQEMEGSLRRGA